MRTVIGTPVATLAMAAALLTLLRSQALGGAWVVQKDDWRVESYNKSYRADTDFDADGNKAPKPNNGEYSEFRTEFKADYGFSDRLNLLLAAPLKWAEYEDDNVNLKTDGVEDIRIGAKYAFNDDPVASRVFSVQATVKIPGGYDKDESPPLGDGQTDVELRLLVGQSFLRERETRDAGALPRGDPRGEATRDRAFAGLELGYRWRADAPADEIVYLAQGGWLVCGGVSLQGELDGVKSIEGTGDEEDYHIWRAGLLYQSKGGASPIRFGRTFGAGAWYGATYAGRNTSEGKEFIVKVFCAF